MPFALKGVSPMVVYYRFNRALIAFKKTGFRKFEPFACDFDDQPTIPTQIGKGHPFRTLPNPCCQTSIAFHEWVQENNLEVLK